VVWVIEKRADYFNVPSALDTGTSLRYTFLVFDYRSNVMKSD